MWDELKKTALGLFIKLTESGFIWAAQKVHFFLTNQLQVDNMHEMWCLIDRRPIRFSLYELENITGLNCDMFDESDTREIDYKEFWNEMGIATSVGPLFTELERVIEISKTWSLEKRMMVGRLCLLSVGVHGIHHGSRVPLSSSKRVLDHVAFEKYPWGRVAFDSLLKSVKIVKYDRESDVIHGCVQSLLVWIYESVPGIGEACGFRKTTLTGVPLFDWRSSRKRFNFTAFIEKEKAAHGQVRVRHMIPVSKENMYPKWSDSAENKDMVLDNLLKDIIHNRLQPHAWTHVDEEEKTNLLDIWNMLEKMNVTISDMDKNASRRLDGLEKKVACLEESVISNEAAASNNNDEYEANSNQPSWVVEEKLGSVDGLPIQRVVKKAVNSLKKKEAATKVLTKKKVAKSNKKKTIVNVEKVEKPKPEMKKTIVKHMRAAMSLFHRRFNRDPSKYPNQRIAILDQDLISTMLKDYKQFQPYYRCFKLREYYEDQVNGTAQCDAATNKKCSFVPSKQRRRSYSKLEWKRITKVPENLDAGDCAIYSIKYIECLALGKSFDGLCDENMQSLRTKLAVEMFEELGENAGTLHSEVRRKAFKFPSLMDE
ncbi:hypothetical protein AXX17_AT1G38830 [Arabidopsis thaliana]|uniref:DUF1985 domain-containing protein n=1 Tax=Arabidopsis thaliana TaxID=3702 RepID=A0A178WHZ9_ARATH|nr:hypothetical protein AXX17_AT1G38830 [Arabidopsis thaliana]